jgi:hypothetical protein
MRANSRWVLQPGEQRQLGGTRSGLTHAQGTHDNNSYSAAASPTRAGRAARGANERQSPCSRASRSDAGSGRQVDEEAIGHLIEPTEGGLTDGYESVEEALKDDRARALLTRGPEGPNEITTTEAYCRECIQAAIAMTTERLIARHGGMAERIRAWAGSLSAQVPDLIHTESDAVVEQGRSARLKIAIPRTKQTVEVPINSLVLMSLLSIAPELVVARYARPFYTETDLPAVYHRVGTSGIDDVRILEYYRWGEWRFDHMCRVMEQTWGEEKKRPAHQSPEAQIIAITLISQFAKDMAVRRARKLLSHIGKVTDIDESRIEAYLTDDNPEAGVTLAQWVKEIREDLGFVKTANVLRRKVLDEKRITAEQFELLRDIAFLRAREVVGDPKKSHMILDPIITAVAGGNWDEARNLRDFLMVHAGGCFPRWRQKIAGNVTKYANLEDLGRAVLIRGDYSLPAEAVPTAYREFFVDALPRIIDQARLRRRNRILNASTSLSMDILRRIERRMRYDYLWGDVRNTTDINDPSRVQKILEYLANSSGTEEEFLKFFTFLKGRGFGGDEAKAREIYFKLGNEIRTVDDYQVALDFTRLSSGRWGRITDVAVSPKHNIQMCIAPDSRFLDYPHGRYPASRLFQELISEISRGRLGITRQELIEIIRQAYSEMVQNLSDRVKPPFSSWEFLVAVVRGEYSYPEEAVGGFDYVSSLIGEVRGSEEREN